MTSQIQTEPSLHEGSLAPVGMLTWAVKTGFQNYISDLPDGVCDISPEITLPGAGRFGFPLTRIHHEGGPTAIEFGGHVVFHGHGGMLHVPLGDLRLERAGEQWLLSSSTPSGGRIVVATGKIVDRSADAVRLNVRLAPEGVPLFGGNYPVSTSLDDLEFAADPRLIDALVR